MSSRSVNARGHAPGSVTTAYRRLSRAIASTRLAGARSAAQATRLRCAAMSIPYLAMTEMTSGCGGSPPRSIPADRTRTATPSSDSRRASSAAAIGDRQTFAVHSTTMPTARNVLAAATGILPGISLHFVLPVKYSSFASANFPERNTMQPAREDFTAPALGVHSFYAAHAGQRGAFGGISGPMRPGPLPRANQRESHDDRIRYRAVISRISADSAPAQMVGRLGRRARPGGQPGVLADRAQAVLGHRAAAGAAVRRRERARRRRSRNRSPRRTCRPSCSWSPAPRSSRPSAPG